MASLNLSINGPSIKSSYQGVVNGPHLSSGSATASQWALFSVQAPLANAFQDSGAKESVLKVESTGDGELVDLVEDFNEGRIQFAFVKVKDPNTGLPKYILIAWCGGGVPERTKGYFTSHLAAVSKVLHGYHVQITARSDSDLEADSIMRKVADASGAKYSGGGGVGPGPAAAPPRVAKKPVFTPTTSTSAGSNPLVAARRQRDENVDADGWGTDAPPVTRTQLEKVQPAYKPTKVNLAELTKQNQEPSRFNGSSSSQDNGPSDVVKGGYQPIGKVDIAAIRAQAQKAGDDRPAPVKGAYEPVGKVDIAAIRARAQKPAEETAPEPEPSSEHRSLADRSAAFHQPERITELPKPKVAKKFGGATAFTGTKAPTPGGLGVGAPSVPAAAPVGAASRTFADQGGKTPAQLWAEKKAREKGDASGGVASPAIASPIGSQNSGSLTAQKSGGGWQSGYKGKSWAVQAPSYARAAPGGVSQQNTGEEENASQASQEEPASPSGGVSALRDRFKNAAPISSAPPSAPRGAESYEEQSAPTPPPPETSRPSGGFQLPGLPSRPPPPTDEEEEEEEAVPPVPSRDYEAEREASPVRVAVPVARGPEPEIEPAEQLPPRPLPTQEIAREVPGEDELPEDQPAHDLARGAATAVAEEQFGQQHVADGQAAQGGGGGKVALIQYDYDKAEDNEIELREGEYVTNIDMVDDDWWMGTNSKGESGLFPSNYVELMDDGADASGPPVPPAPVAAAEPEPPAPGPAGTTPTATALFDYEAAEDNELSFDEGAKITELEFPDEDWWFGHHKGKSGLFPANYVQLDS